MSRWVTVFRGKPWEVSLRVGHLEEEGIVTFQPSATLKVMDPFATGALPLDAELQVPEPDVERALLLLEQIDDAEEAPDEEALVAMALAQAPDPDLVGVDATSQVEDDDEPEADEPAVASRDGEEAWTRDEIADVARRTRWAALLGITMPLALFFGWVYFGAVRESGLKDESHALTVVAFWIAVVTLPFALLVVLSLGLLVG